MSDKNLQQLFEEHTGRVSDKWSLYLTEYERLFDVYRDKPVHLLEIGIQNGGSLEIWSKYFSNASALIGCDINSDCALLSFDDSSIEVVIGDANAPDVCERVFQRSSYFDIIIDDGSHLSSDIIKSFALYFPRLVEGGLYIAEDLHCSYWSQFEGGLFDPYSSISFFKLLADVINHAHWGTPWARVDILRATLTKYGCEVDLDALSQVHSVEFINSMCVVRKEKTADNGLGLRVISGSKEQVLLGHLGLHAQPVPSYHHFDQTTNPWTPSINLLIQPVDQTIWTAQQQIVSLRHTLVEMEEQISRNHQIVKSYQDSTSWRLTKPLRFVGHKTKQIKNTLIFLGRLLSNLNELKKIYIKFRNYELVDIEHHIKLLQSSEEYAAQVSKNRGLSPKFLSVLIILGTVFLEINQWLLRR